MLMALQQFYSSPVPVARHIWSGLGNRKHGAGRLSYTMLVLAAHSVCCCMCLVLQVLRGYIGDRSAKPVFEGQTPFNVLGGGYQRPFELATLRLSNMIGILPKCALPKLSSNGPLHERAKVSNWRTQPCSAGKQSAALLLPETLSV